jgi:hypothetical protein
MSFLKYYMCCCEYQVFRICSIERITHLCISWEGKIKIILHLRVKIFKYCRASSYVIHENCIHTIIADRERDFTKICVLFYILVYESIFISRTSVVCIKFSSSIQRASYFFLLLLEITTIKKDFPQTIFFSSRCWWF